MSKTISMQSAVKHIMGYVTGMSALLSDDDKSTLQAEQAAKAVALITSCKVDASAAYEDGNAALALMQGDGCPWSASQKSSIAAAIRLKVEGTRTKTSDQQDNEYTADYLPEWLWGLIKSHCNLDYAYEHIATYSVATMKLRNPSETTRRDLVALCFAARSMTPTNEEALNCIEKMRKHFDAARAIHPGVKGPATYPSDPAIFVASAGDSIADHDRPVPSKVSTHALSIAIAATKCRKAKDGAASISVRPSTRASTKTQQVTLKKEDAVDHIARFVAGEIAAPNVADLPGALHVLHGGGVKAEAASANLPPTSEPSVMSVKAEAAMKPETAMSMKSEPAHSAESSVGNLDDLRQMTALKFAKLGVQLDGDGRATVDGKGKKAKGKKAKAKKPSMKRPAAALKRPASAKARSADGPASAKKRPAAAASAKKRPSMPKGWAHVSRATASGRIYPVWTSPKGKLFYSWKQVKVATRMK